MVIVNFDTQECSPSSSDKRVNRIQKRRNRGIHVSALDHVLRNAHSTSNEIEIKDLPEFQYSHIYNRTKHFLASSFDRVKDFGKYLRGSGDYCTHCREYRQLFEEQAQKSTGTVFLQECYQSGTTRTSKRFSDTFVEKVRSQQKYHKSEELIAQENEMPCCAMCKRPRPSVEFYCACEEPPRRVTVSGGYRHGRPPPTRYWTCLKKKKHKSCWCCNKKQSDNWCCCCHQKIKRVTQLYPPAPPCYPPCVCPCPCPPSKSMLQRFKQYMNGKMYRGDNSELQMYNACMERPQRPSCNWCSKGYTMARADPDFEDYPPQRPRSCTHARRPSVEEYEHTRKDYHSEEEYIDEPGSDSDDCCCCCPCRKNFNTCNVQTDDMGTPIEPKTIDTQTERCCGKRRCCKCCRNACGICNRHPGYDKSNQNYKPPKNGSNRRPPCARGPNKCMYSPESSGMNSPSPRTRSRSEIDKDNGKSAKCCNRKKKPVKTIICKAASVQHGPSVSGVTVFPSVGTTHPTHFDDCGIKPCHRMQSVMFNTMQPTPLFLDKMFAPINPLGNSAKNYKLPPSPVKMKMTTTPFLSTYYQDDAGEVGDNSEMNISTKTKQRFMNAVCDSILCDLTSKRRNSFSNLLNSPDSGYQEAMPKKSFFSLKPKGSSYKVSNKVNHKQSKTKFSMDHMIKTLKGDKVEKQNEKVDKNVMGKASKVVRNILEEISTKKDQCFSDEFNSDDNNGEVLKMDSLRNILLNMNNKHDLEQSRSDSVLLDFDSLPGTSTGGADGAAILSGNADSYTKLIKALGTIRNRKK